MARCRVDSDTWCSPLDEIVRPLHDFFGGRPTLDPCSNKNSVVDAVHEYLTGGLHRPWFGQTYENRPYSKNDAWVPKVVYELHRGEVTELVELMMIAPSTKWWQWNTGVELPPSMRGVCRPSWRPRNPRILFTKRLKFIGDQDYGARFDTALFYFGPRAVSFDRHFKHVTRWSSWGRGTRGR